MTAIIDGALHGWQSRWRFASALLLAAVAGVVGCIVGWLVLSLAAGLVAPGQSQLVQDGGTILSGSGFALLAFFGRMAGLGQLRDVMGSAQWASPRQVAAKLATPALSVDPAALLIGRGIGKRGALLRYAGPAHLLTIAPTRSGKGVGTVLPNLLLADRSVICVDPKGENARMAACARRRFGPVWILDPFGASGQPGAAYDPTSLLNPKSVDLMEDAATLADALVYDPPGQVAEAHWNDEAKALIAGLLMYLACNGTSGHRGLGELRRLLMFFNFRRPDWSLIEVGFLWASILAAIVWLADVSTLAAWLLVPYLAWVTFATWLNLAIVRLNGPFRSASLGRQPHPDARRD